MTTKVFRDNIFPKHVADLLSVMHLMVFDGTDGEEDYATYLSIEQKECIALGLALYYQCSHCINHHTKILAKIRKSKPESIIKNMSSIILFLRTDLRYVTPQEQDRWKLAWDQFTHKLYLKRGGQKPNDKITPYLIGLAIGISRDDDFLINFLGEYVKNHYPFDFKPILGELESVVIFMKAATSKNRIADKLEQLLN